MGFELHPDANQISALLGGDLRGRERRHLLRHLSACEACRHWAVCTQLAAGGETELAGAHAPVRAWSGAWRLLPPALAAGVVLAASGLWMQRATLTSVPVATPATLAAALRPARPDAARRLLPHLTTASLHSAPAFPAQAERANIQAAPTPAPAASAEPAFVVSTPSDTAVASAAEPGPSAEPLAVPSGEFQPSVDFSPLTTGFQDQPVEHMSQPELADLSTAAPSFSNPHPAPAAMVSMASLSTSFNQSFGPEPSSQASRIIAGGRAVRRLSGPLAPAAPTGLGWAISRSGEVLRSIGSGIWATVPLLPGMQVHALFASGDLLWAGGTAAELFVSKDRGSHWRHITLPENSGNTPVTAIRFRDAHHGIVVLSNGDSWRTNDGGRSWQASGSLTTSSH